MLIEKIRGSKCFLSPFHVDYLPLFVKWWNDLDIIRTMLPLASAIISSSTANQMILSREKKHSYMIVDLETYAVIGSIGLSGLDQMNGTAELGIYIGDKGYWGKGYAKEASFLMLTYAFEYLALNNIMLQVYEYNERAIRLYKSLGFKIIGVRRKAVLFKRTRYDIFYMDIVPSDFNDLTIAST